MRAPRIAALLAALAFVTVSPAGRADGDVSASADPALATLLGRLAGHAAQFEEMKRRGAFTLSGRVEELDRRGHVDELKEMVVRVTATPAERVTEIVRYAENGADKTAYARRKAAEGKGAVRELHLPFLASEQHRYAFSIAERSAADPSQVRVVFTPRSAAVDAYKGSAWVDERSGEVLTMGLSPSKNPRWVDHVDVTMRFDLPTPLGRAPSSVDFDARGGFLFVRKRYRGSATISDARLAF